MSKKPQTFNVTMDRKKNPALRQQMGELRGGMIEAAERNHLPERFIESQHPHRPAVRIMDQETGRITTVPLFAYGEVRKALNDLYGPPKMTVEQQFAVLKLPMLVEGDGFRAVGVRSPFEDDDVMYRIEVDGIDGGELGVARIEIRGPKKYAVLTQEGFIAEEKSLKLAMQSVELDVMPDLRSSGPRP